MKTRILIMFICLIFSVRCINSQETIRRITPDRITHSFFKKISPYYGKTSFPFYSGKLKSREYYLKFQGYEWCPYKKYVDSRLPLYAGTDKNIAESEQFIMALFYETNGEYFIGVSMAWSANHNDHKRLLTTYSLDGNVIDYIIFEESNECSPEQVYTVEGVINKDLTVNIYSRKFVGGRYPVNSSYRAIDGLEGQRIDYHYKITPQGKFSLLREVKYQPKKYVGSELSGTQSIANGNELKL